MTYKQQKRWWSIRYFLKMFTPTEMRWSARLAAARTRGGWKRSGWQEWFNKLRFVWTERVCR